MKQIRKNKRFHYLSQKTKAAIKEDSLRMLSYGWRPSIVSNLIYCRYGVTVPEEYMRELYYLEMMLLQNSPSDP